jgi:predicted DNA-binding protein (MmcQ/YjbR family)
MNLAAYNRFCQRLPHTNHVVQWGDAHVWKVATKVFAIARLETGGALHVTFKCSWTSFEILKEQPGLRPAPYLASRGMSWIQRTGPESMDDAGLRDYLRESHRLAAQALSKKVQRELGLTDLLAPQTLNGDGDGGDGNSARQRHGLEAPSARPRSKRSRPT